MNEYTAAPVFMNNEGKCRHQWVIEFEKAPADMASFTRLLDEALQRINSDYEAKRYKDITLQQLEIIPARKGLFNDWLKSKGKFYDAETLHTISTRHALRPHYDRLRQPWLGA